MNATTKETEVTRIRKIMGNLIIELKTLDRFGESFRMRLAELNRLNDWARRLEQEVDANENNEVQYLHNVIINASGQFYGLVHHQNGGVSWTWTDNASEAWEFDSLAEADSTSLVHPGSAAWGQWQVNSVVPDSDPEPEPDNRENGFRKALASLVRQGDAHAIQRLASLRTADQDWKERNLIQLALRHVNR